jgi:hypothetical protein
MHTHTTLELFSTLICDITLLYGAATHIALSILDQTMKITVSALLASVAAVAAFTGSSNSVRSSVALQESQVRRHNDRTSYQFFALV